MHTIIVNTDYIRIQYKCSVFLMETDCVFCAVRTGVLYVIWIKLSLQNIKLNTTFIVIITISKAEICVIHTPTTFITFRFIYLFMLHSATLSVAQTVEHRVLELLKNKTLKCCGTKAIFWGVIWYFPRVTQEIWQNLASGPRLELGNSQEIYPLNRKFCYSLLKIISLSPCRNSYCFHRLPAPNCEEKNLRHFRWSNPCFLVIRQCLWELK
jgi:hypothetical protein